MEHPGVERCWPRSPHPTPEFSTLRCFLQGFQSHLRGATALPTPRTHRLHQHGAGTAGWCCLCPTAACGHVPTGSPPRPFGGSGCSRRAAGSFSFAKEPRGDPGMERLGKLGGCVLAGALLETLWGHVMLWPTHGPITPTPLPSQQWEDLGKVLPNFPLPREFTCGSFFQDLDKNPFLRRSF